MLWTGWDPRPIDPRSFGEWCGRDPRPINLAVGDEVLLIGNNDKEEYSIKVGSVACTQHLLRTKSCR